MTSTKNDQEYSGGGRGHVFLSYASEDRDRARMVADHLEAAGLDVWWDRKIMPGDSFARVIEAALDQAYCVVVLWTANAVRSKWVCTEAEEGASREILVPVLLEQVTLPLEFRRLHFYDLRAWGVGAMPEVEGLVAAVEAYRIASEKFRRAAESEAAIRSNRPGNADNGSSEPTSFHFYSGGFTFLINKQFGSIQLVPTATGLRFRYVAFADGRWHPLSPETTEFLLPLDALGGIWATTKAFIHCQPALDENVIMKGDGEAVHDILLKLYRDKANGEDGRLTGNEGCWLRIVNGPDVTQRRRILLGKRDLWSLDLAIAATLQVSAFAGTHRPEPYYHDSEEQNPFEAATYLDEDLPDGQMFRCRKDGTPNGDMKPPEGNDNGCRVTGKSGGV